MSNAGTVKEYTKKPVVVEAICLNSPTAFHEATVWMSENLYVGLVGNASEPETLRYPDQAEDDDSKPDKGWYIDPSNGDLMIRTMEGDMRCRPYSYVIQGVEGEFYPCDVGIFLKTYDEAEGVSE